MAKKKFNKEERKAIINKLTRIANERTDASWKKHREAYVPSETYLRAKELLEQRNQACEELKAIDKSLFNNWNTFEIVTINKYLKDIRDTEIKHLIERYRVDENNLEVEIILMDQESPIDDLIEQLLKTCLCK